MNEKSSIWHNSYIGVAVCDTCDAEWSCHESAWGNPKHTSTHSLCGGIVRWHAEYLKKELPNVIKKTNIIVSDSFIYDMFQKEKS